jgi:hypothetical protein
VGKALEPGDSGKGDTATRWSKNRYELAALAVLLVLTGSGIVASRRRGSTARASSHQMSAFPLLVLWAWERPEDLSFIDPKSVGVAFLAKTVIRRVDSIAIRPRLQPLTVPEATKVLAVVRIEDQTDLPIPDTDEQRSRLISEIVEVAASPRVAGIQIDFDARASERRFYASVLAELRARLPQEPISITALASWCVYDKWLAGLPVDEAVPMQFRMGADARQVSMHLESGGDFGVDLCRQSVGISTDEPAASLPEGRRIYAFSPKSWSAESFRKLLDRISRR